jgi:hypothetical protein
VNQIIFSPNFIKRLQDKLAMKNVNAHLREYRRFLLMMVLSNTMITPSE